MFFRLKNIAPYRRQARFEMKHHGVRHLHALSNGLLLSIEGFHDDRITALTLFDPKTTTKVGERLIATDFARMIPLDDECFLLKTEYDDKLHILSAKNLETREDLQETISNFDTGCPISNNRFLSIHEQTKTNIQLTLMSHDCETKQFNQEVSSPVLIKREVTVSPCAGDLIKLDNGQIAFKVLGHNTDYFTVFVFDKKVDGYEFSLSHSIHPKTSRRFGSCASGNIAALTKGRLLTYHDSGKHFQLWEGKNCVKEWNWITKDTRCEDILFKVAALPDGDHLLVLTRFKLFLFNMETVQIQTVNIGTLDIWSFCIYPNGQTIISATNQGYSKNILLAIDFASVADYRKSVRTLVSQAIGRDPGSIVNGYLGHDGLWVRDETPSNPKASKIEQCIIS